MLSVQAYSSIREQNGDDETRFIPSFSREQDEEMSILHVLGSRSVEAQSARVQNAQRGEIYLTVYYLFTAMESRNYATTQLVRTTGSMWNVHHQVAAQVNSARTKKFATT